MGANTRIALALGAGYLLGRRRRLRSALMLGAAAAVGRMTSDPQSLLQRGTKLLGSASEVGRITELGKPLTVAGKAAAAAVVSRGIDSVGDRMHRRADLLHRRGRPAEGDEPAEDRETDEVPTGPGADESSDEYDEDEYDEDEYDEPESREPEPEPERRPRTRPAARSQSPARARRPAGDADRTDSGREPPRRSSRARPDDSRGRPEESRGRPEESRGRPDESGAPVVRRRGR